jgi:hypothetical protein
MILLEVKTRFRDSRPAHNDFGKPLRADRFAMYEMGESAASTVAERYEQIKNNRLRPPCPGRGAAFFTLRR